MEILILNTNNIVCGNQYNSNRYIQFKNMILFTTNFVFQKPAEVSCIQCSRTYCAYCQLENHRDHEYKKLNILNEENKCAFNNAKKDFSYGKNIEIIIIIITFLIFSLYFKILILVIFQIKLSQYIQLYDVYRV